MCETAHATCRKQQSGRKAHKATALLRRKNSTRTRPLVEEEPQVQKEAESAELSVNVDEEEQTGRVWRLARLLLEHAMVATPRGMSRSPRSKCQATSLRRAMASATVALILTGGAAGYWLGSLWHTGEHIGDGATSERDARVLFEFLDTDADGQVEESELFAFVGDSIGGHVLDSTEEIEAGVASILDAADRNEDSRLSTAETREYWKRLGSLLSVEEVAAWVEHAVQLPSAVARQFREASVSGYDFAELVRDGLSGDGALARAVGVHNDMHRRALVRAMRMRLTGVGRQPTSPAPLVVLGKPKCTQVRLAWSTSDGGGFPTHKFVLERRRLDLDDDQRQSLLRLLFRIPMFCLKLPFTVMYCFRGGAWDTASKAIENQKPLDKWTIVSDDYTHEFSDNKLVPSAVYDYRVAAWNAIGRSAYATRRIDARRGCEAGVDSYPWALASLAAVATALYAALDFLLSAAIVSLAILKLTAGSADYPPIFAKLWNAVCSVLDTRLGRQFFPAFIFEVSRSGKESAAGRVPGIADPALVGTLGIRALPPEMDPGQLKLRQPEDQSALLSRENSRRRLRASFLSDEDVPSRADSITDMHASPRSYTSGPVVDDCANPSDFSFRSEAVCHICRRPFVYAFRSKHHCYVCAKPFCRMCGRVSHSHFRTCPVGARCVCFGCRAPRARHDDAKGVKSDVKQRDPRFAPLSVANLRKASASSPELIGNDRRTVQSSLAGDSHSHERRIKGQRPTTLRRALTAPSARALFAGAIPAASTRQVA